MVVEHAHLRIFAGREERFEAAFLDAEPILTGASGCVDAALFRDVEHPGGYLLRVRWQSLRDHVEVFPISEAGTRFASRVAHFFAEAPTVHHFADAAVGA